MSAVTVADASPSTTRWSTTVGRICHRYNGEVQTGPFGSQLHASDYCDDGTPVVMPQDLKDGKISTERIARVGARHVSRLKQHKLRAGDIVYSRRGDVGRFAVVSDSERDWLCGTGCIRIRLNCPELDIAFVRRYLQQPSVEQWLRHHAKGVTMPNLNTAIIRALPIVYPPLPEQRRIAAILDQADALRAKRHATIQKLDELTQSIFLDMFGDPATNPKGWPTALLQNLCTRVTDGTHQPPRWSNSGHPFLFVSNITSGELTFDTNKFISDDTHAELMRHCPVEVGDVLYSTVGSYGVPAMVRINRKFAFQRHIAHLKPDHHVVEPEFLRTMLASPPIKRQADRAARGIAQKTVNLADIRKFVVFKPPLEVQRSFVGRVSTIRGLRAKQSESLDRFDALFASLQHRAFRGDVWPRLDEGA